MQVRDLAFANGQLYVATDAGLVRASDGVLLNGSKYGSDVVAASADGRRIYGNDMKKIYVIDTTSLDVSARASTTGEGPIAMCESPDGAVLIVASGDEAGHVSCFMGGAKKANHLYGLRYASIAWLDARRFVSACSPHAKSHLRVHNADGSTLLDLGSSGKQLRGLVAIEGSVFAGTKKGILRYDLVPAAGDAAVPFTRVWEGPPVNALEVVKQQIIAATEDGVYRVELTGKSVKLAHVPAVAVAASGERVAFINDAEALVEI